MYSSELKLEKSGCTSEKFSERYSNPSRQRERDKRERSPRVSSAGPAAPKTRMQAAGQEKCPAAESTQPMPQRSRHATDVPSATYQKLSAANNSHKLSV